MLKTKMFVKLLAPLILATFLALPFMPFKHVQAQSLATNVSLDWIDGSSSCYGLANGQTQAYYAAVKGDSISLHVTNASSYNIDVDISEAGQSTYSATILPSNSVDRTLPVNSEITLDANGQTCTSGHGGPGSFYVEAATGSVSCSISSNQVWNVSVNYSNVFGNASLYRGSTFVAPFNGIKNSQLIVTEQFSAMSTAATYNLYYGSNNSSRLLGSASCPAKKATAASTPTGSSSVAKPSTAKPDEDKTAAPTTTPSPTQKAETSVNQPQAATVVIAKKKSNLSTIIKWSWLAIPLVAVGFIVGIRKFAPNFAKRLGLA